MSENNDGIGEPVESQVHQEPGLEPPNSVGSKDDAFVDAPDEQAVIEARTSGDVKEAAAEVSEEKPDVPANNEQIELEKMAGEEELIVQQYKEEREALGRELGSLRRQLKAMTEQQTSPSESNGGSDDQLPGFDSSLHDLINECSQFLKTVSEERLRTEGVIRELNRVLPMKDREIEDLNAKVMELSVSRDVTSSYMDSVHNERSGVKPETDVVTGRILASLSTVVNQDLFDDSGYGELVQVEKGTSRLIEKYNQILHEVDLLRECLPEANSDLRLQDEFGVVFVTVRNELQQLTKKEADLVDKLTHLEDENRKIIGQLDECKLMAEQKDEELGKMNMELEQEKTRCATAKEKLSLAVTKGKALVQQRDSLKTTLADKTSELERCLVDMREKSTALNSANLRVEELIKSESLATSVQETLSQRNAVLGSFEEILSQIDLPEELQSIDIFQKYKWIVGEFSGFREDLADKESLISALQEMIQQKDAVFENIGDVLSQASVSEEVKETTLTGRIKRLVDEKNVFNSVSLEFHKLKDGLQMIDLPEHIPPSDWESRLHWLRESFHNTKYEVNMLKNEIARTEEAAHNVIGRLSASLSAELQENDYLKMELNDMTCKYRDIVIKENQVSKEKDHMVKMLLEVFGVGMHDEGVSRPSIDTSMLIERCIEKIKEYNSSSLNSSRVDPELIERIQNLLYVRTHELMLCEELLEEDIPVRSDMRNLSNELKSASKKVLALKEEKGLVKAEVDNLSNELSLASQELLPLKEEKGLLKLEVDNLSTELSVATQELLVLKETKASLQKDVERSEEKAAILKDKLSMAVKKGKGLVQDRENIKNQLDEKNSAIEKLRVELQEQVSDVADCRNEINALSTDLERIPELEADIVALKEQKNKLEQFLLESNDMLQRMIESIDDIILPVDSVFEEPVQKVKWIATYLKESQDSKSSAEKELDKVKEEADSLARKLLETQTTLKSVEDALLVAENNLSQLAEEKREIEFAKTNVEKDLKEASLRASEVAEVYARRNSLEDALSEVTKNISVLNNEKEAAQHSKADVETELEKLKAELTVQTSKLAEAYTIRGSLEDELSGAESNIALMIEESNTAQVGRTSLENELQKIRDEAESQAKKAENAFETIKSLEEEAESQAKKLENAFATVQSLEDAVSKAEDDITVLESDKKVSKQEISTLNAKLSACMDELAGTSGSLKTRSVELIGHLNDLQVLMKDDSPLSIMKKCFGKKLQSLKDMDLILNGICSQFGDSGSEVLQSHPVAEDDLLMIDLLPDDLENILSVEMGNEEANAVNGEDISLNFKRTVKGLQRRNKIIAKKFEDFSVIIDEFAGAVLGKLLSTRDEFLVMLEHKGSLEKKLKKMEMCKQEQANTITSLETDVKALLSACCYATKELQIEIKNNLFEACSIPELEELKHSISERQREDNGDKLGGKVEHVSQYKKEVDLLLLASRKMYVQTKQLDSTCNVAAATIEDLQNGLEEVRLDHEKVMEERDFNQNKVSKLESDMEALQSSCSELRLKLQECQETVNKLKEREAELVSLYKASQTKEKEMKDSLLSPSEVKIILEKLSEVEVPFAKSEVGNIEVSGSVYLRKLLYTINNVAESQHQINRLSRDKEELQSSLARELHEIEHLEEEVATNKENSQKMKSELSELTVGLLKIRDMLDEKDFAEDQKSAGTKEILPALEKHLMTIYWESENSKSKSQELATKLVESHKVVQELSNKVKVLEESDKGKTSQLDTTQERSIFEAPSTSNGLEISEVEDAGSGETNSNSPPGSSRAAHVRTMKKGSSDHLALNIDVESAPLINEQTDEDKGHVFMPLNSSGLIPAKGKVFADRVDGVWVSSGRLLMSHPRARLGLIGYWLIVHIWLLLGIVF